MIESILLNANNGIDVPIWMMVFGLIMILGFIGNYIFNKTQIPNIVWLLIFGLILGLIFNIRGIIDEGILITISDFFAAVAIIIILFDGGINIDLYQLFRGASRGLLLTVTGFCLSLLITMFIVMGLSSLGVLPLNISDSMAVGALLGAIIGGTSSPIVIPLACKLQNLQEKTKMVLSIESILTDPLAIVVFLAGFYMVVIAKSPDFLIGAKSLVSTFSIGIVLGLIIGFVWLPIMNKVRKEQFAYILTLAVAFIVYAVTSTIVGEQQGGTGAGAIACLMFGLVLGNGKKILRMVNYQGRKYEMDEQTKHFHALTSFVIRTFFFVYLGILVSFQNTVFIIIGIIILLALLGIRYIAVFFTSYNGGFEKDDCMTMNIMLPRGLAAAILAINFGPRILNEGLNLGNDMKGFFQDVSFVIILGTAIITTVGVTIISHYEKKKIKEATKELPVNVEIIDKKNK